MHPTLIITQPGDIHAALVAESLGRFGQEAHIWDSTRFPAEQTISWALSPGEREASTYISSTAQSLADYGVIWFRRARSKRLFSANLHQGDMDFVRTETNLFIDGLYYSSHAGSSLWVNDPLAKAKADSKLLQLKLAARCGLTIPPTLVTNDPRQVEQFATQHRSIINKSFHPMMWTSRTSDGGGQTYANYTSMVNIDSLDCAAIEVCPTIFQAAVEKALELRILLCGKTLFCVAIESQSDADAAIDFRAKQMSLPLREFQLPPDVRHRLLAFAEQIGVVFGSIDMILTPQGDYVFLEINEQGQFLWMEENNPELPVLQLVTDFFLSANPLFSWQRPDRPIKMNDCLTDSIRARVDLEFANAQGASIYGKPCIEPFSHNQESSVACV